MEREENLKILRDSTVWFIQQDPTMVQLLRSTTIKTPSGGTRPGPSAPLTPQEVKLIGNSESGISKGEGGVDRQYEYTIVFPHDGDVQLNDKFKLGSSHFVIYAVEPDNGYERKVRARQYSTDPTDG